MVAMNCHPEDEFSPTKDLRFIGPQRHRHRSSACEPQILRCAQDDNLPPRAVSAIVVALSS